ncbi:MAG: 4-(cytidine 5'-diphospho)-2-C-methyl-D-erythritol kinase [Saccharofermentanales bacterium]
MGTIKKIRIMTPAKINLSLDVTGEREDGYHLLETVMQSVALYDKITVSLSEPSEQDAGRIVITARNPAFPCDSRNTCHKAAALFSKAFLPFRTDSALGPVISQENIHIHIDKDIPLAAGLGGGSADAAAVLTALNELYGSPFTPDRLSKIGSAVGADVPFCLIGGTVLCEGIGDILKPLPPLDAVPVVIVKANFGVSTQWVFKKLKMESLSGSPGYGAVRRPDTQMVVRDIEEKNIHGLFMNTANVLESVTIPEYPVIALIKSALADLGASGSMMSGSGPSVFGMFETDDEARIAAKKLKEMPGFSSCFIFNTRTTATGLIKKIEEI